MTWDHHFIRKIFYSLVFLGAGVGIGWYAHPQAKSTINGTKQVRHKGSYTYINPLLECEIGDTIQNEITPINAALKDIVNKTKERYHLEELAVYFRDLNDGPWVSVNGNEQFSPSSLLKVPIFISFLDESDDDPSVLDKKILYDKDLPFDNDQTIKPQKSLVVGQQYTVRELLEYMIRYSSNNAANMLYQHINKTYQKKVFDALGIQNIDGSTADNYSISVIQYASFFRVLFNASYLSRQSSEEALGTLAQSEFKDGIVAGVPSTVTVSHKFGERKFTDQQAVQLHDCGIIYYPGSPYLLCIMSKGENFGDLSHAIASISKEVYTIVDTQMSKTNHQ